MTLRRSVVCLVTLIVYLIECALLNVAIVQPPLVMLVLTRLLIRIIQIQKRKRTETRHITTTRLQTKSKTHKKKTNFGRVQIWRQLDSIRGKRWHTQNQLLFLSQVAAQAPSTPFIFQLIPIPILRLSRTLSSIFSPRFTILTYHHDHYPNVSTSVIS